MHPSDLVKYQRRLRQPGPWLGRWRQRRAFEALAADPSPEAAQVLAEALASPLPGPLRERLVATLRGLSAGPAVDAVCAVWAATRDPELARLLSEQRWPAATPPKVRVLTALKHGQLDWVSESSPEAVLPLVEACTDVEPEIARVAREGLIRLRQSAAVDLLCHLWVTTRQPMLAQAIVQARFVASTPPADRLWTALLTGQLEALEPAEAAMAEPVLEALEDRDPQIALRAREAIDLLRHTEVAEAICRLVLDHDLPAARQTALAANYAPKDPQRRALFFFLTEQWEQYDALDFDRRLLSAAFAAADRPLRARLAGRARRAGRAEWVQVISQGRQDRRLEDLTPEEWETTVAVLVEASAWPDAWRLAQAAPPDWSACLLYHLRLAGWQAPSPEQREGLEQLTRLAEPCWLSPEPSSGARRVLVGLRSAPLGRLAGLEHRFTGHLAPVSCLALSPDAQTLASGSQDHSVRLWRTATGEALHVLEGHSDWVSCLAFSPNGRWLASGGQDKVGRLWNVSQGQAMAALSLHTENVRCLAFTLDSQLLITGSEDRTIRLWRMPSGQPLSPLTGHNDLVHCLALSPDGKWLASGSYDGSVRLWSLPAGEPMASLGGHKSLVNSLAFSPDSRLLASGGKDRSVMVWAVPRGARVTRIKGHRDDVTAVAFTPDGQLLASASWDNTVRLWSLPEGRQVEVLGSTGTLDGHSGWVTCLAMAPDGQMLASGSLDQTVRLWSLPAGRPIRLLQAHQGRVSCLALSRDGQTLVSGGWDGTLCLFQSQLLRLRRRAVARSTVAELAEAQEALADPRLERTERVWLDFIAGLMRWRRRFDIQLEERAPIAIGEFDIEVEG